MNEYIDRTNRLLDSYQWPDSPAKLYDAVRYALKGGGKRLRPALTLAFARATGTLNESDADKAAMAIEMFHNYTLVHDDIMDKSPKRHGRPTVWVKYGEPTAILAGDILAAEPYRLLASMSDPVKGTDAAVVFHRLTSRVLDGQQSDMDLEGKTDCTVEQYLDMIAGKTASLLALACQLGAIASGADKTVQQYCREYGFNLGMAFQIIDDMLDTYGDAATFGKPIGGDILNDKNTYLRVLALRYANDKIISSDDSMSDSEKIESVRAIYDSFEGRGLCIDCATRYTRAAIDALSHLDIDQSSAERLVSLAKSLIDRSK